MSAAKSMHIFLEKLAICPDIEQPGLRHGGPSPAHVLAP
jgi:hypothetical protein